MTDRIKTWLAVSPIASGLRTAVALGVVSALNYVSDHFMDWSLSLPVQLLIASAIPPMLRAVNDKDGIFGIGSNTIDEPTV